MANLKNTTIDSDIKVGKITDEAGTGSPTFPNGLSASLISGELALSNMPDGSLIQAKALIDTTRRSGIGGGAGTKINFGPFTKLRSDTTLFVHFSVPYERTQDSDAVNVFVRWNGVETNLGFSYVDHENNEGMSVLTMDTVLRGASAGTSDFEYGYPNNIGSGIGDVINPDGNDDSRISSGTGTVMIIYEVVETQ